MCLETYIGKDGVVIYRYKFFRHKVRHQGTVGPVSREEALAFERQVKQQVAQENFEKAKERIGGGVAGFDTLVEKYLASCQIHLRPRTVNRYRNQLRNVRPYFGQHSLKDISPILVETYQTHRLAEGRSPLTTNHEIGVLMQLANWGYRQGYLKAKPERRWRYLRENRDGLARVISDEEESRLLLASPLRLRPLIVTALHTGLRKGELLTLRWDAVNLQERTLTIRAEYSKNRKEGVVPLNDIALKTLAANKPPQAEGLVFGYHSISETFIRAARRANLPGVSCHTLRHTYATRLVVAGVPLGVVKELMRHSSIDMTMRYTHPQMDHLQAAVARLSGAPKPSAAMITA